MMLRFLPCAPAFLACAPPLPLLLFALNLPHRLEAAANALSGMVNTDLLRLLHGAALDCVCHYACIGSFPELCASGLSFQMCKSCARGAGLGISR
jgi:hypothetical protein